MQRPSSRAEAFAEAAENLRATARNVALLWAAAFAKAAAQGDRDGISSR
jgi:hypothetical protein